MAAVHVLGPNLKDVQKEGPSGTPERNSQVVQ
jgi:hypothetical protein